MKYKMLVIDLDDTLLTDNHTISDVNKKMLLKAQEHGVYVVLASGRPTAAMYKYAHELDLAKYNSYIIAYNGGEIIQLNNNEIIFQQSLSVSDVHSLYDFTANFEADLVTYFNNDVVAERASEYVMKEVEITGLNFSLSHSLKSLITESVVKCIIVGEPNYLLNVQDKLGTEFPNLSNSISKPFFLEVTQKGIDKAASLAHLAHLLQINSSEIIAVGNAQNDLSMIQYAGLGVWVDNVNPELRHLADVIVSSNNDHGVAEVVEKYILL